MLEVIDVTKEFNEVTAVKNVSFNLEPGKVLGIVGRNGAGKSTIFRMILKLIDPTNGKILYNGNPISDDVLNHFGFLPEEGSLMPQHTVIEICEYYGALKGMSKDQVFTALTEELKSFEIEDYFNRKVKTLSKGNRQKIQFIISTLHDPELIILDEPFSGLDPVSTEELKKAVLKLKERGKTIIFSSHIMTHVEDLCDDLLLIDKGESLLYGNLKEILSTYMIDGRLANSLNEIFIDKVGEDVK